MSERQLDNWVSTICAMGFHAFLRSDEPHRLRVSAEHGDDAADYYDVRERLGPFGINKKLHEFAEQFGGHWEWDDPGSISFYVD